MGGEELLEICPSPRLRMPVAEPVAVQSLGYRFCFVIVSGFWFRASKQGLGIGALRIL